LFDFKREFFLKILVPWLVLLAMIVPARPLIALADQIRSTDKLSEPLIEEVNKLLTVLTTTEEKKGLETFLSKYEALLTDITRAVKSAGEKLQNRHPELSERVERETKGFPVRQFTRAPVVLFNNVTEDDIRNSWRNQLQANLEQIQVLLRNVPNEVIRHQWVWYEDYRKDRRDFFLTVQIRDCLKEANKLGKLLIFEPRITRVAGDASLFKETFSDDLSRWEKYGEGNSLIENNKLFMRGSPLMVWTTGKPFNGNCMVVLEYTPVRGRGGAIFAFPGSPINGINYSVSAGRTAPRFHIPSGHRDPMEPYNHGIQTYHVSVHRGRTHLRRTGSGLKMLNVLPNDPCAVPRRNYRIEIIKFEETLQFLVDGKLIHSYVDAGVYGPPLIRGQFGIKQFGNVRAFFDNVRIQLLRTP